MAYKLFDVEEGKYVENMDTFDDIRDFLAEHWAEDDGPTYGDIRNEQTAKELQGYAEGLGYAIEAGEPVAVITMSNTCGVLIYEATSEYVLAGCNDELPEYYEVQYELPEDTPEWIGDGTDEEVEYEAVFYMGEWRLSLSDAMRINF